MRLFGFHRHKREHPWTQAPPWADELGAALELLFEYMEIRVMPALDDLTAQVAANRSVIDSAITLINGIADRIAAAGVDPVKLAALTTDLKAEDDELAKAVEANQAPTPTPPPA